MENTKINYNLNAAKFDSDVANDSNMVLLDNKTAFALNIIADLLARGNTKAAGLALSELRLNGRLYNSQKYYNEVPAILVSRKNDES